jgi:hypothetical protein
VVLEFRRRPGGPKPTWCPASLDTAVHRAGRSLPGLGRRVTQRWPDGPKPVWRLLAPGDIVGRTGRGLSGVWCRPAVTVCRAGRSLPGVGWRLAVAVCRVGRSLPGVGWHPVSPSARRAEACLASGATRRSPSTGPAEPAWRWVAPGVTVCPAGRSLPGVWCHPAVTLDRAGEAYLASGVTSGSPPKPGWPRPAWCRVAPGDIRSRAARLGPELALRALAPALPWGSRLRSRRTRLAHLAGSVGRLVPSACAETLAAVPWDRCWSRPRCAATVRGEPKLALGRCRLHRTLWRRRWALGRPLAPKRVGVAGHRRGASLLTSALRDRTGWGRSPSPVAARSAAPWGDRRSRSRVTSGTEVPPGREAVLSGQSAGPGYLVSTCRGPKLAAGVDRW